MKYVEPVYLYLGSLGVGAVGVSALLGPAMGLIAVAAGLMLLAVIIAGMDD
jgi:hypothetical protein